MSKLQLSQIKEVQELMSDLLQFDAASAEKLQKSLERKVDSMKRTLDRIKRLVEQKVNSEWKGASAQEFINLYAESNKNAVAFLASWTETTNAITNEATRAKAQMEEDERAAIQQAKSAMNSPA